MVDCLVVHISAAIAGSVYIKFLYCERKQLGTPDLYNPKLPLDRCDATSSDIFQRVKQP